jgi:hypothetical protein
VVRATMMRGTLHLVSARDYLVLRPALQPGLEQGLRVLGERMAGLDSAAVTRAARELLGGGARTFDEVRAALAPRFPDVNERALGYAVRMLIPLVQLPSDSTWGFDAGGTFALAESWLGAAPAEDARPEALVRRYLAAFGPATPADAAAWSGLRGLRAAFDALRPELVTFRDGRGRELFDLADAPRPGGDADAPVRFLPEFDNLVLAHEDRTRVVDDAHRPRIVSKNLQVAATFLVDGRVAGTWKGERARGVAVVAVQPFAALRAAARRALEAEGEALARFLEPDARGHEVRIAAPG